jgi:hypothetical protein
VAGGPILPSSIYVGATAGNITPSFYVPNTNTVANQGVIEGVQVALSLTYTANATQVVMQFNMPESLPTGTMKLRVLAMANATSGTANWVVQDGVTSPAASIGTTSLTVEASQSITWAGGGADILQESKQTLTASPSANQILTVIVNHAAQNTASAVAAANNTLAQISVWQYSIVWE